MYKFISLVLLIGFTSLSFATLEQFTAEDELKLIKSLKNENLITKRQFQLYQSKIAPKIKKPSSTKGVGTAIINGHVQDDSATPLPSQLLRLHQIIDGEQYYVDQATTDMSGNYTFTDLAAGSYVVHFGNDNGEYLRYMWHPTDLILCTYYSCVVPVSSHIEVVDAAVVNNIDFTTKLGGKITGVVSDVTTMSPVSTFFVQLENTNQEYSYSVSSPIDQLTGTYSLNGIPDGNYRVYLSANEDNLHIPQIYGGPECNSCNRLTYEGIGTVLNINMANTINSIDFALNVGATIQGNLVDNITLNPLAEYGLVMIFNEFNYNLAYIIVYGTNIEPLADGSFVVGGLLPGSYFAQGGDLGREFYQRELYNNRPCYYSGCDRGMGDVIALGAGENRVGINFLLDKGGKISGTILDEITGLPVSIDPNERLQVQFYDASENVIGASFVSEDGSYISARSLPAGNYAVRTGSMFVGDLISPYVNEKYNDIECSGIACDLSTADVAVATETTTANIDFALTTGNSFSGTVTDLATSAPIAGVNVLVYKDMGAGIVKFANWAQTSDGGAGNPPIGTFEVSGLPDGTYYAKTGYGSDLPFFVSTFHDIGGSAPIGWIDILYENMPCLADCDVTLGTPIVLPVVTESPNATNGTTTVNFALTEGAIITGHAKDFIQHAPLQDVTINIYNDQGTFMGSSITDAQGNYISRGLPAGTYYLTTSSLESLLDVKYGNDFCTPSSCNPLDANPITVTELQQLSNQDFTLKTAYMHMFSDAFE